MRIFLIGDYKSGTGPANVTNDLLHCLPFNTLYLKYTNKILRTFEIISKMFKTDICVFSGYSKQNILGMRTAKFLKKPTVYLMHGCVEYENAINGVPDIEMNKVERETMRLSNYILAVSEQFEAWLKVNYKEYSSKIYHLTNGVNWKIMKENATGEKRDPYKIFSIGGGMPRKKIVYIAEAIELLNKKGIPCTLTIAGDIGLDSEKLNQFSFVTDLSLIKNKEVLHQMHTSKIFIQNSCFETFGLAPIEALLCGCDILLSKEVGAISLFQEFKECDKINNFDDPEEIAKKIEFMLNHDNHSRLLVELDKESTSWEARATELQSILKRIKEKKSLIG